MSQLLINRSRDLNQLRNEGYDLEIRSGYLLVKDIPYVNSQKTVGRGMLVSKLSLAGDLTSQPDDHVASFRGDYPCREDGTEIEEIRNQSETRTLAEGVVVDHTFSAKPKPEDRYPDYYAKVTTYVAILSGPAEVIIPGITAKTFPALASDDHDQDSVFHYIDTATSRAEITNASKKLEVEKIAIIGLGGTGAYVLDLVVKSPVKQIHLFDADLFSQHNAFRSPGAASLEDLRAKLPKVVYYQSIYSKMHRHIFAHNEYICDLNASQLKDFSFVFICLDNGDVKKHIIPKLEEFGIPFIDVGMGIHMIDGSLGGILRVTTSTPEKRDHVWEQHRIPMSSGAMNDYAANIQIADLNALNAALAVIRWKKYMGFYRDFQQEHFSTYTIDGNLLLSEDRP